MKIDLRERIDDMISLNEVSSKAIKLEVIIKLMRYLKRKNAIDDRLYNNCVDKLMSKLEKENLL